ncbi:MAG: hypothetical protein LBU34_01945 [Planctomycetaceae bacterium]|nr:hypothetical protein [Planctomycetaceae bacterium]
MSQPSVFDVEYQLDKINQINDFLRRLDELIDWSIFFDLLNQVRSPEKKSYARRPAFDVLLMFKILVLKTVYKLISVLQKTPLYPFWFKPIYKNCLWAVIGFVIYFTVRLRRKPIR